MNADEKECPYCAEVIKAKAVKCRFCGEALTDAPAPPTPAPAQPRAAASSPPAPAPQVDQAAYIMPGIVIIVGAVVFFNALSMDTTVSTELGAVSNFSLMQQQSNMKVAGGFIAFLGFCWGLLVSKDQPASSSSGAARTERIEAQHDRLIKEAERKARASGPPPKPMTAEEKEYLLKFVVYGGLVAGSVFLIYVFYARQAGVLP